MTLRPLIFNTTVEKGIARVKRYARENKLDRATVERLMRERRPVGDVYPGGRLRIPVGYRVYFSIEEHPVGWCYHLSVSVDEAGSWPNQAAVAQIARMFGMEPSLAHVYAEEAVEAVNLVQPIGAEEVGLVA